VQKSSQSQDDTIAAYQDQLKQLQLQMERLKALVMEEANAKSALAESLQQSTSEYDQAIAQAQDTIKTLQQQIEAEQHQHQASEDQVCAVIDCKLMIAVETITEEHGRQNNANNA
jgi:predicted RNase H-like nuclease (RuvC/YqgF family)